MCCDIAVKQDLQAIKPPLNLLSEMSWLVDTWFGAKRSGHQRHIILSGVQVYLCTTTAAGSCCECDDECQSRH